jgi:TonB family protein
LQKYSSKVALSSLFLVIFVISFTSSAQEDTREVLLERRNELQQNFLNLYDQERYQQSILTASEILNITQAIYGPESPDLINPLNNLASSYFMVGDFEQATKLFLECIALIESKNNISSELISPLVALGLTFNKSEQYNEAVKIFNKALHINWVNNGFHNLEQINIHDSLTESFIGLKNLEEANHHQSFQLGIYNNHFGKDSIKVDESLEKLANWYKRSGQILSARLVLEELLDRQVNRDLESKELIKTLQSISFSHRREGISMYDSVSPLKKALNLFTENQNQDLRLKLEVLIDLGDTYTSYGRVSSAVKAYQDCWQLIEEDSALRPEIEKRFSKPVKVRSIFIPKRYPINQPIENKKDYELGFLTVRFDVETTGKTNKVIIIESDPSELLDKTAISAIKSTKYRPTYIDAEAQRSEGLTIRHEFSYRQAVEEFTEPIIEDKPLESPIA